MPVRDINRSSHSGIYLAKDQPYKNAKVRLQFDGHLWKPTPDSPQPAHFGITGVMSKRKEPMQDHHAMSYGCLHDELDAIKHRLRGRDVLLPKRLRWHLFDVRCGPMHFGPNAAYWLQLHLRREGVLPQTVTHWTHKNGEARDNPLESFKRTVLFGELEDDAMPELPDQPRRPDKSNVWIYDSNTVYKKELGWELEAERRIKASVTEWCAKRLPRLMALFEADMVAWFGPDIMEGQEDASASCG